MDENTKTIDQVQVVPAEVNAEVTSEETPIIVTEPTAEESKTPPVPLSGEAENTPSTPASAESYGEAKPAAVPADTASSGSAMQDSSEVKPASAESSGEAKPAVEPIQSASVPKSEDKAEPATSNTPSTAQVAHPSSLEALGASFIANMKRARELLVKARATLSFRRKNKIEKVMTLFVKKSKIVNQDVRDLLHTTEHTATDYLNVLVKEGKIKKEGENNKAYYTKI